jgi:hypothetical protein
MLSKSMSTTAGVSFLERWATVSLLPHAKTSPTNSSVWPRKVAKLTDTVCRCPPALSTRQAQSSANYLRPYVSKAVADDGGLVDTWKPDVYEGLVESTVLQVVKHD